MTYTINFTFEKGKRRNQKLKLKTREDCLLREILCVITGNAPPIIDYPVPTIIVYADGE